MMARHPLSPISRVETGIAPVLRHSKSQTYAKTPPPDGQDQVIVLLRDGLHQAQSEG
jgi:hypothetical protein